MVFTYWVNVLIEESICVPIGANHLWNQVIRRFQSWRCAFAKKVSSPRLRKNRNNRYRPFKKFLATGRRPSFPYLIQRNLIHLTLTT